jgi:subtilisin family serine protease
LWGWAPILLAAALVVAPAAALWAFPPGGAGSKPEVPPPPTPAPRPPEPPPTPDIRPPPPAPTPTPVPLAKPPPSAGRNPPAGGGPPPADTPKPGTPPAGDAPPGPKTGEPPPPKSDFPVQPPRDPDDLTKIPRASSTCPDCKELADRINQLLDELVKIAKDYNNAADRKMQWEDEFSDASKAGSELETKLAELETRIYGLKHDLPREATEQRRAIFPDYTRYDKMVEKIRKMTEQANELRRQLIEELKAQRGSLMRMNGENRSMHRAEWHYQRAIAEIERLRRELEQCDPERCEQPRTRRVSGLPERLRTPTGAAPGGFVGFVSTDSPEWCSYEDAPAEAAILVPVPGTAPPTEAEPPGGAPPEPEAPAPLPEPTTVVVVEPAPESRLPAVTAVRLACGAELGILRRVIERGIDDVLARRAAGGEPLAASAAALGEMLDQHAADAIACRAEPLPGVDPKCLAAAGAAWGRLGDGARVLVERVGAGGRKADEAAANVEKLRAAARASDAACVPGAEEEPAVPSASPAPKPEPQPEPAAMPEPEEPEVRIYVKARASVLASGKPVEKPAGAQVKLLSATALGMELPGSDVPKDTESEAAADPVQGTADPKTGALALAIPARELALFGVGPKGAALPRQDYELAVDATDEAGLVAEVAPKSATPLLGSPDPARQPALRQLHPKLLAWVRDVTPIGDRVFVSLALPASKRKEAEDLLAKSDGVLAVEEDVCRDKEIAPPNDPSYRGRGAWGQRWDDQWAIRRVGFGDGRDSAWKLVPAKADPVTVAVVDTGLDWHHLDFDWQNLWRNPRELPGNGADDDGNGYADDVIGWDFAEQDGHPWDHDGHGTVVAGIIAARSDNGVGIAGINPHARIMVLRALNSFGHSRASKLARAIVYAADNGARVVNLSVGGEGVTAIERSAVEYALAKDVVIVVAAGNQGRDLAGQGIASLEGVIAVAATGFEDERQGFSNHGAAVDLAAPGLDVLGLRARRTDTMRDIPEVDYVAGANVVGADRRYYRASGTSFAAPIVAGVASLVRVVHPELPAAQVRRVLAQSARDVGTPGWDPYTGHGMVDARAALAADPARFVEAHIDGAEVVPGPRLRITGTADSDAFDEAWLELGEGDDPKRWRRVGDEIRAPVRAGTLGEIDPSLLRGARVWTLRLVVQPRKGEPREMRFRLELT